MENFGEIEKEKIQIAACFHDLGIWTASTLDYLSPSEIEASQHLKAHGKDAWSAEILEVIAAVQTYPYQPPIGQTSQSRCTTSLAGCCVLKRRPTVVYTDPRCNNRSTAPEI